MKIPPWARFLRLAPRCAVVVITVISTSACGSSSAVVAGSPAGSPAGPSAEQERGQLAGEQLFKLPFPGAANSRACATCHVPGDSFALSPAHVERLMEENPNDPLFAAIDADDPAAEVLTFEHLRKGLVRVWLTLPNNMDMIDAVGHVTTPADRRLFVWRSVPSISDTAFTGPFQLDGRAATLEEQAQGAISSHSQGGIAPLDELRRIAQFERGVFSSDRARVVADRVAGGAKLGEISDGEDSLVLSLEEQRGKEMFKAVCASCHGGGGTTTIVDRSIHDQAFPALKPDGNVLYPVPAALPPTPVLANEPTNEFINIGSAMENFLVQIGATEHESFTGGLSFPQYRFRFYKDDSRTEVVADLPPIIPPGNPGEPDENGNPTTGPNFSPQEYTTDPGRAAITGNPHDFEAFDIPNLRGISKTGPYWHNNISATLEEVVDLYSDHLLAKFPSLTQPGEKEVDDEGDIGPEETFTLLQKSDLVAYLKRL